MSGEESGDHELMVILSEALDNLTSGIIIIDQHYFPVFVNRWVEDVLRQTFQEIKGKSIQQLFPGAKNTRFFDAIDVALKHRLASRLSALFNKNILDIYEPMGRVRLDHSINISSIAVGEHHYCLINIIDDSKPLRREVLLQEYIGRLKETEEQLNRAKDQALEASQAKSDFIASMSHQLKTPLNAIVGFSELLTNKSFGELSNEQMDCAQLVLLAGKRLSDYVSQILWISEGHSTTVTEPINIIELIQNALGNVSTSAEERLVSVRFTPPEQQQLLHSNKKGLGWLLNDVLMIAVHAQENSSELQVVTLIEKLKNEFVIALNGRYERIPLVSKEGSGAVGQKYNDFKNTELDLSFLLNLSQRIADELGICFNLSHKNTLTIRIRLN